MKTRNLFFGLFAALAIAGCSSEDAITSDGGNSEVGDGDSRYLTVNIVNYGSGTRAGNTAGDQNATTSDGTYENGLASENEVSIARFYFFDSKGKAVNVKIDNGTAVNYAECKPSDNSTAVPNVEQTLTGTVVLETFQGDPLPAQMVAVLNATGTDLGGNTLDASLSLTELQAILAEGKYKTTKTVNSSQQDFFVMSSSAYLHNASTTTTASWVDGCPTAIDSKTNLQKTKEAAGNNPVNVYVERTAAKVRVKLGDKITTPKAAAIKSNSNETWTYVDGNGNDQPIYVKFVGWDLTNTAKRSYLLKKIYANWITGVDSLKLQTSESTTTPLCGYYWNYDAISTTGNAPSSNISYRSFWAENPSPKDNEKFLDNSNITATNAKSNETGTSNPWTKFYLINSGSTAGSGTDVLYCLENAADPEQSGKKLGYNPKSELSNRTQVVLKAQLTNSEGTSALDLAQWQGVVYTRTAVEEMMVEQAQLALYTCSSNTYSNATSLTATGESPTLTFAAAEDAVAKVDATATPAITYMADKKSQNSRRYLTYIQFKGTDEQSKNYYKKDATQSSGYYQFKSAAELNAYLSTIAPAKVWKGGNTYFYVDLKHLGTSPSDNKYNSYGEYGVVRNHIYEVNITDFTGLGTPVTTSSKTGEDYIIPQKTLEENWYLAAAINILSWRVVPNETTLDW